MKIKNFKKEQNEEDVKEVNLAVSDILIDVKDFLEYYNQEDYGEFSEKLKNTELPEFDYLTKILRKYKNISFIKNIQDATVDNITSKRYEIRNAINTVLSAKDRFSDLKSVWTEIEYLLNKMYERTKDTLMVSEDIKGLKNNDLRIGEVNFQLKDLVKTVDKVGLIMVRFKQVSDEIKETLLYLQDVKEEVSRIQSSMQLALDTGEIERVYWNK